MKKLSWRHAVAINKYKGRAIKYDKVPKAGEQHFSPCSLALDKSAFKPVATEKYYDFSSKKSYAFSFKIA